MKTSPLMLDASKTRLPEGKQSRMPDSAKAVEQYSKLYVPVAKWGFKPSCLGEMLPISTCSSGVSKLVGATFHGSTIDYSP